MQRELLDKLRNDKKMYEYLQKNSYWFKELNRNAENYSLFIKAMKDKYRLKATDKLEDAMNNMEMVSEILSALK